MSGPSFFLAFWNFTDIHLSKNWTRNRGYRRKTDENEADEPVRSFRLIFSLFPSIPEIQRIRRSHSGLGTSSFSAGSATPLVLERRHQELRKSMLPRTPGYRGSSDWVKARYPLKPNYLKVYIIFHTTPYILVSVFWKPESPDWRIHDPAGSSFREDGLQRPRGSHCVEKSAWHAAEERNPDSAEQKRAARLLMQQMLRFPVDISILSAFTAEKV